MENSQPAAPARGRPVDAAKREAIVAAAARCFFDNGYAASSIEQIAAEAGVSKVTIYNQFGDKRVLFAAAVEHECAKIRGMLEIGQACGGSLRERLHIIGETMTAFIGRPEMVRFDRRLAAETERDPQIGLAFLNAGPYRMKAAFAALLEAMVAQGELEIADCALAAEQFVSMCKGVGDLERRYGQPLDPAADAARVDAAVNLFLRGYGKG